MSFEIAFIILIFTLCSYAIVQKDKLYIASSFFAVAPLAYFFSKDYALYPFLFAGTCCIFTNDRKQMPFMIAMLSFLSVAKLNLELELLAIYASFLVLKDPWKDEAGQSLEFIMPLSLVAIMIVGQFANLQIANLIQIMAPIIFLIVWQHFFILTPSFEWKNALDGKAFYKLFLAAYILPLKLAPLVGEVVPYINPKLLAFSAYSTMLLTLAYACWILVGRDKGKVVSLLFSLSRLLVIVALCSGVTVELKQAFLIILFLELIGRLLLVGISAANKGYLTISPGISLGLRLAILGFLYQFLLLPGSLSSYLTSFLVEGSFQQSDFVWQLFSYLQIVLVILSALRLIATLTPGKEVKAFR